MHGCVILDILEDIWDILEILVFFCKVGECIISEIIQEVAREVLLKSGSKSGFKWNHRVELMEELIVSLDIWDKHVHRSRCKVLEILGGASYLEERRICDVWYHEDDSRQGPIGSTFLQVEDYRSYGAHDFLGARGSARGWEALSVMDAYTGGGWCR